MSDQSGVFAFADDPLGCREADDFVARIPPGIATRDQLFDVLSRELELPSYFGRNWDALSDCLRDLSWIDRRRVVIAHEAVPNLDAATLRSYLVVLAECVIDWKPSEQHVVLVVFPKRLETHIRGIVKESSTNDRESGNCGDTNRY